MTVLTKVPVDIERQVFDYIGTGAPGTILANAAVGATYRQIDGGVGSMLWQKSTAGWEALQTSAWSQALADTLYGRLAANNVWLGQNAFTSSYLTVGAYAGVAKSVGDIVARRSATTGVIYFGESSSSYLYWDGTSYFFGGTGGVIMGGMLTVTPNLGVKFSGIDAGMFSGSGMIYIGDYATPTYGLRINYTTGLITTTHALTVGAILTVGSYVTLNGTPDDFYSWNMAPFNTSRDVSGGQYPAVMNSHTGWTFTSHDSYGGFRIYAQGYPVLWTGAALIARFRGSQIDFAKPLYLASYLVLPSGQLLYWDGGGDTYTYEAGANVLDTYVGGLHRFRVYTGYVLVNGTDFIISATKKFYLDDGSDTYIDEVSANALRFVTAGQERFKIAASQSLINTSSDTSAGGMVFYSATPTLKGRVYWDSGGIGILNDQDNWSLRGNYGSGFGGTLFGAWTATTSLTSTDFYATGGWFRSTGNAGWFSTSYSVGIYATAAGIVRTYNGAAFLSEAYLQATTYVQSGTYVAAGTYFLMNPGQVFYLDGGSDTYMYEATANKIQFVAGGLTRFQIGATYLENYAPTTGSGGMLLYSSASAVKGYVYWDSSGSGMLTDTGNWGMRMNYGGGAAPGGTLYGAWAITGILTLSSSLSVAAITATGDITATADVNVTGVVKQKKGTSTLYDTPTVTISSSAAPGSSSGYPTGHIWIQVTAPI